VQILTCQCTKVKTQYVWINNSSESTINTILESLIPIVNINMETIDSSSIIIYAFRVARIYIMKFFIFICMKKSELKEMVSEVLEELNLTDTVILQEDIKEDAKTIRKILKERFKGTKFSVRMGSGYSSIKISWKDGPPEALVDKYVKEFESYQRDERSFEILSGGNTFVFTRREISPSIEKQVEKYVDDNFNVSGLDAHEESRIKREVMGYIYKTSDLSKKLDIVPNDKNSALMSQMFIGNLRDDKEVKDLIRRGIY